jgi:hypothetical protein
MAVAAGIAVAGATGTAVAGATGTAVAGAAGAWVAVAAGAQAARAVPPAARLAQVKNWRREIFLEVISFFLLLGNVGNLISKPGTNLRRPFILVSNHLLFILQTRVLDDEIPPNPTSAMSSDTQNPNFPKADLTARLWERSLSSSNRNVLL